VLTGIGRPNGGLLDYIAGLRGVWAVHDSVVEGGYGYTNCGPSGRLLLRAL
jgi:hypothetical protein